MRPIVIVRNGMQVDRADRNTRTALGRHATAGCCGVTVGIRHVGMIPVLRALIRMGLVVLRKALKHDQRRGMGPASGAMIGQKPAHSKGKDQQRGKPRFE